jgi:hypothetical protein
VDGRCDHGTEHPEDGALHDHEQERPARRGLDAGRRDDQ